MSKKNIPNKRNYKKKKYNKKKLSRKTKQNGGN